MDTTTYAAAATVTRTVAEKKIKRRLPEVAFTPLDLSLLRALTFPGTP